MDARPAAENHDPVVTSITNLIISVPTGRAGRLRVEVASVVRSTTSVIGRRPAFPIAVLLDPALRALGVEDAVVSERPLFADGRWQTAQVFDRGRLPIGARLSWDLAIPERRTSVIHYISEVIHGRLATSQSFSTSKL
jgi:hypothetical protein